MTSAIATSRMLASRRTRNASMKRAPAPLPRSAGVAVAPPGWATLVSVAGSAMRSNLLA